MSDLYQTNLTDKDKKRCLIRLMEGEDDTGVNMEHFFRDRDYEGRKEVTFGNFKNVLEKALPNISRDEVNALFQEFQIPGNTNKANYESFLFRINSLRKKRRILNDILEQILENFSSRDNTLFDLFEKADKDQNGTLSKKEFLHVLDDFGVYYDADEMEDFFFFLDTSGDNSISYKELNEYFTRFVKKKGKNLSEITRSSFFKDPKNYWGRKIFEDAHRYLTQSRQTLQAFFREEGMENDFSISQFDFTKAMNTLVKNLNDDDLFRLVNEMDDKTTKKISIKKFQEVYDAIVRDSPNLADSSPANREFEREKKYKDMLKSIGAVISAKHFSYDDFFGKHGYNRHLKTIHEHKFDAALNELDLRLIPDDVRLLKSKLDPDRSGILALDDLFEIKADSTIQTDYIKTNLTARETQELKSLLSDFVITTNKRNINLMDQFNRYDFKKEGQLTNDEFVIILKDNQLNIGAQDQDLLIKAFGDSKTRKVNYRAFCDAVQANLGVSQLSQSGFGQASSTPAKFVDPAKVEQKEKELYTGIRQEYATLEDLFVAYDRNKDNTISKPEFVQMLKALKVEMTNDELDAVFDKIDKAKVGKIYFVNMTLTFKPYIEADVRDIISQIIKSFVNDGRSYIEVLKNFPQSSSYMKFIDFMDALQSLSKKTNLRDVQFLLSHLNIKLNPQREINWEEFATALQSAAKRLNVINDVEEERVFRKTQRQESFKGSPPPSPQKTAAAIDKLKIKLGLNSKEKILDFYRQLDRDGNKTVDLSEFKRTVKVLSPTFTDDELNQAFRAFDLNQRGRFTSADLLEVLSPPQPQSSTTGGGFGGSSLIKPQPTSPTGGLGESRASQDIIEKTIWAKEIFENIRQMLERKGENFHNYFRVDNQKANIIEVKLSLNRLDINMNEKVSHLLNDLCDEIQPNMINLYYFEKCYNYHKDKYEAENARLKSPTDPYKEIREALKSKYLTFEDSFAKYDAGNRGYITTGAFKTIVEDDLRLYLDNNIVRRILDQTADNEGRVSLTKLRDGIGLSRREEPQSAQPVDIEALLKTLRTAMKNNDLTVDRLFSLFDQSKDGRISWDEFQKFMLKINGSLSRNEILGLFRHIDKYGSGEISAADFRNVFEDAGDRAEKTVQALKDMIKRNNIDTKKAFEMFDRNRNDKIEFSELNEVISSINPDLGLEDKRVIFRRLDVNGDGHITKTEFIKTFGSGTPSAESGNARTQRILEDIKKSMKPRNREETQKLFAYVDVNRDGKVTPQEFTQFVQQINPSIEKNEAFDIFKIFDANRDGSVSFSEFLNQFNVNNFTFDNPPPYADNRNDPYGNNQRNEPYGNNNQRNDPYNNNNNQRNDPYGNNNQRNDPYNNNNQRNDPYNNNNQRNDPYGNNNQRNDPYNNNNNQRNDPYNNNNSQSQYNQSQGQGSVVIERTRWAGEFFEEVGHLLRVEQQTVTDYFFSYDNTLDRLAFRKKLEGLGFDLQPDMFDRLTKALADQRNPDKIDLNEFNKCFDYYKNNQKVSFPSLKFQRLTQVSRDMKASAHKDGLNLPRMVDSLVRSRDRTCSKSDLEGLLLDKLRLTNNTNIKILYDHLAVDPEKRTMDIKKLEDLINDQIQGAGRDNSPNMSFGGQDSRYDDPYKRSLPPQQAQDPYNNRSGYGDQGAYQGAKPGEVPRHAVDILDRMKSSIDKLGVNIDQIYKRFVPNGADFITYDQFYKGIMNIDQNLTRDDVKAAFSHLDKENSGRISKIRFMTSLGKIASADIPAFLDWAKPFFREVNKHLEDSRSDLSRVMKPHKGLIEKGTFRQGLYVVGVDTDKYAKEVYEVSEILLEGRQEGMNYDVLEACLRRAKEPDQPVWTKKTNFTADDQQKIQKMFQEIAKFMKVDNLTFEQLFMAKDTRRQGWLTEKETKDVLFNELYVTENPMIDLLVESCKNDQGNVDLLKFRDGLKQGDQVMATVMTLEHFLKELRERFKNDSDSVVKFFDANNNKSISRKEFVDCCKNAMNTDKELALFYFSQLDKGNKGEITTMAFKDSLEHDQVSSQQILGKLKQFVVQNKNYILRSFQNLDDSRGRSLTISQMKIAFSNAQFTVTIEELTAVIQKLNVRREGQDRYNYEEFIERICNIDPEKENLEEIDNILGRLKAKLIAKNVDLIPIFKKHDTKGDNTISMHDVYEDLAAQDIYLNKHEKDLLVPFLQPVNDRINYYDFSRLIFNGRDKLKTKDQFLREAAWAKDIAILTKDNMRKKNLSTSRLFGVREGQEFVNVRDFYDGLEYIGVRLNNSEMKRLIELLSPHDRPDQVSITMFEYLLQNVEDVQRSDVATHSAEEMKIIDQRFAEIRQFMKEDRKTFAQIFPKYDRNNSGYLSMNDMKKLLDTELGLEITPKLEQFVSLLADRRGMISLDFIRSNTEVGGGAGPGPAGKNVSFAAGTSTSQSQFVTERPGTGNQSLPPGSQTRGGPPFGASLIQNATGVSQSQYGRTQQQQQQQQQRPTDLRNDPRNDPRYDSRNDPRNDPRYDPRNDPRNDPRYGSQSLNQRDMNAGGSQPGSLRDVGGSQTVLRRGGQPIEFSGDLVADMKKFFRDRGYSNAERFAFFGADKGVIPRVDFLSKVKIMDINNLKESAIVSLFERLDANRTGQLSENEFRATFDDNEAQYQTKEVNVTKEMDEEIYQLFREIDTDHSNSLTIDEVVKSIGKLGANPTTEEVNRLFAELDKNGDGKISYQEFRSVMADKLKNNILQLEGLLHDLRTEFKRADLNNRGVLSRSQLNQALINLHINLSNQELDALISEIDRDRSGTIDIDEFIGFIMTPPEKSSFGSEADAALMNIKKSRKLSLLEVLDSFKQMPYNFTQSFTRDLTRKCLNLPSSSMRPKPNSSGVSYADILPNINKSSQLQKKSTSLLSKPQLDYDIMTTPSTIGARITLNLATGVPIPSEHSIDRNSMIVGREVRAIIYSKTTKTYIGNLVTVDVEWNPTFEDRWSFLPSKTANENALLLRLTEFNQTKEYDTGLTLVFEFVIFFRKEKELIEMSCGWADIEINELRKSQIVDLKIKGGSPLREININEVDVRANRKGWRNIVKNIAKTPITSKLKIEIKNLAAISVETREDLEFMPAVTLINRNAIGICKVYRNYLGRLLKEAHQHNRHADLNNDVLVRTFWKTMDCPDSWGNIVYFWNNSVNNVNMRARNPEIAVEFLRKLLKNLYMMFSNVEYRFNDTDPCQRIDFDPNLRDNRRRLLVHYTENSLADMQIRQENFRPQPLNPQQSSFKPFNIGELIEDDHDHHTINQLQSLKSSTNMKY